MSSISTPASFDLRENLRARVSKKENLTPDIVLFELANPDGGALPAFTAGAHIDVNLPGGLTRQYSLCNAARERHRYQIAVLRSATSRGGSRAMHDDIVEGQLLTISAPRNLFPLIDGARRTVLVAGGIGVTPLLSMAEELYACGGDFELKYCTRSSEQSAFRKRLLSSPFADRVHFHFDDGLPEQRADVKQMLPAYEDGTHLYVCGPTGFMDAILAEARACGWHETSLHSERFSAKAISAGCEAEFNIQIASTGVLVQVAPGQTAVQALAACGVWVPTSCEQGVCGTCATRVLSGEPDHRDQYLTPDERKANDQFLPCCSRARSPLLVLDL